MTDSMTVDGIDGCRRRKREKGEELASKHRTRYSIWVWRISGMTRDGTVELVSRDQILY